MQESKRKLFRISKNDLIQCKLGVDADENDVYICYLEKRTSLRERLRRDYDIGKYRKEPELMSVIPMYKSDEMFAPILFDGKMRYYPSYNKTINVIAGRSGKCEILTQPDSDAERLICKF